MPYVFHDNTHLHYTRHQKGTVPLVFCHPIGNDSAYCDSLLGDLPNVDAIYPDIRAHGATYPQNTQPADFPTGPLGKLNFQTFADDLFALVHALRLPRVVVGGVSMGAGIATRFALQHPSRVMGLVITRPAWLDRPRPAHLQILETVAQHLTAFGPAEGKARFSNTSIAQSFAAKSPSAFKTLLGLFDTPGARQRAARFPTILQSTPVTDMKQSADLKIPTLILAADNDPIHPEEIAATWHRHLPHARFEKLPSKSENPTAHAQQFRQHLVAFIQSL